MTKKEKQALLIFERKILRRIDGPTYEKRGREMSDESRSRRDKQMGKYSRMYKRVKERLDRSPSENGGG